MTERIKLFRFAILPCLMAFALTDVAAAQVTAKQQGAIRASCTSDFMAKCSGVTPDGKDALLCLQKNVASLAPACKAAVTATIPAPAEPAHATAAPAVAPVANAAVETAAAPTKKQLSAVKLTCRGDFTAYCRGVQPGGPEALACLQRNAARLSQGCRTSLADIAETAPAPTASTALATAEPSPRRLPPGITPVGRILRRVMEHNH